MKVLIVNVAADTGSTGKICTDLAAELENKGHEVKIAYGRKKVLKKFEKYVYKIGTDFDVNMHVMKARFLDASGWGSRNATKRFVTWIKEYNPDVIHIHNVHGYYLNIEIFFEFLHNCNKRIIWTLHDCWAFTGHSAYCDAVQCEKWKDGCGHCPQTRAYPKSYIDCSKRNWKKKKDYFVNVKNLTLVCPSEWLARLTKQSFLSGYPIKVIHNGIDTQRFYPLKNDFREIHKIGNKTMLLGVSTAWDDMKGLSDYIKLADMLGDGYKIVLVGVDSRQKEKIPDNILALERTNSSKELACIYTAADALVVLSKVENYPTCILEAEACGTYIITYDTGGCRESITDDTIGKIVPKGDIEAIYKAVVDLNLLQKEKPFPNRTAVENVSLGRFVNQYITTLTNSGGVYLSKN